MAIKTQDTRRVVELYEPNLARGTPKLSPPTGVRNLARSLNGSKMTLAQAVARFQAVSQGTVRIAWRNSYIGVEHDQNFCRIIKFR